uniref:Uncharacterized protein n=1 Tax=Setaria viridis TaxID=4556 RepID=A0A4U6VHR4_SETVI|nr:hypothetical protein SEVIR_3G267700v2 [Setaria viridis]
MPMLGLLLMDGDVLLTSHAQIRCLNGQIRVARHRKWRTLRRIDHPRESFDGGRCGKLWWPKAAMRRAWMPHGGGYARGGGSGGAAPAELSAARRWRLAGQRGMRRMHDKETASSRKVTAKEEEAPAPTSLSPRQHGWPYLAGRGGPARGADGAQAQWRRHAEALRAGNGGCVGWAQRQSDGGSALRVEEERRANLAMAATRRHNGTMQRGTATAQATSLACWHGGGGYVRGWSNEEKSTCGDGLAV